MAVTKVRPRPVAEVHVAEPAAAPSDIPSAPLHEDRPAAYLFDGEMYWRLYHHKRRSGIPSRLVNGALAVNPRRGSTPALCRFGLNYR